MTDPNYFTVTTKKAMCYAAIVVLFMGLFSCSTKKQIIYLQDIDAYNDSQVIFPDNTIQPNDILSVQVASAVDTEASEPYNKSIQGGNRMNGGGMQGNFQMQGYLVSKALTIKLPVLGEVSVANKTLKDLEIALEKRLIEDKHLTSPTVMVTLLNAKFTTLGEMGTGTHYFNENNLTILQAIGRAGDLNIQGKRSDIIVIREVDGIRQIGHVDLTASNLLDSPYYFIKPNDVIYVKPNDVRVRSAGFITGPSALIGFATLLVTTALLITK
ncbi:polysaccharide biosynthesis/export family protein [Winogradskyella sp.]|uniref:polysaccharide biosynthesis/export family protein n=1 Tax=Winogradskyella sp. TaxID=1883156 RepID=UPI003F6D9533